ncbi:hypothetical protein [Niveibacterium sp.]|uniref:hypothetical protein n=1 Tax=Niveibacterium sp. TaxID=2017444 RepID=UPI0035ADABBE
MPFGAAAFFYREMVHRVDERSPSDHALSQPQLHHGIPERDRGRDDELIAALERDRAEATVGIA